MTTFLKRHQRSLLRLCGFFAFVTLALFIFREPLLRKVADLWVVDDRPASADAVVVLGGGLEWRPLAAAAMFHKGEVRKVLIAQTKSPSAAMLRVRLSDMQITKDLLISEGVPTEDALFFGKDVTSCHDEAVALAKFVPEARIKSLLIPTDPFHTRRVKWIFTRALRGTGCAVYVRSTEPPNYSVQNWWRQEDGVITLAQEMGKMLFYWLHY